MNPSVNVFGNELQDCSKDPLTGWYRDGCCNTDSNDRGLHVVCCIVTEGFLNFAKSKGNDLITPAPQYSFQGLKKGDHWCICLERWKEALHDGLAPKVVLESTNIEVLNYLSLQELQKYQFINN